MTGEKSQENLTVEQEKTPPTPTVLKDAIIQGDLGRLEKSPARIVLHGDLK